MEPLSFFVLGFGSFFLVGYVIIIDDPRSLVSFLLFLGLKWCVSVIGFFFAYVFVGVVGYSLLLLILIMSCCSYIGAFIMGCGFIIVPYLFSFFVLSVVSVVFWRFVCCVCVSVR